MNNLLTSHLADSGLFVIGNAEDGHDQRCQCCCCMGECRDVCRDDRFEKMLFAGFVEGDFGPV